MSDDTIDALYAENRTFPPQERIKAEALVTGTFMYDEAAADDEGFWAQPGVRAARLGGGVADDLRVEAPAREVVRRRRAQRAHGLPRPAPRRGRGKSGDRVGRRAGRHAHADLRRAAREVLPLRQRAEGRGVKKGDRVTIYMPMIPEAAVAMLACARLGAAHSSCSAASRRRRSAIASRTEAKCVITADGGYRRGGVARR